MNFDVINKRIYGANKRRMSCNKKTYLLHGNTQIPQHFSMPLKFFSASRISALIWSIPSSMRSSCSIYNAFKIKQRLIFPCNNFHFMMGNDEDDSKVKVL